MGVFVCSCRHAPVLYVGHGPQYILWREGAFLGFLNPGLRTQQPVAFYNIYYRNIFFSLISFRPWMMTR